ncbi:hypothetical protein EEB13_05510 [Rhodococcus sp. WS3]|uniref:hypothetical protein n=1 Tax=Rhodococcus sp. WS3 TaxID=2486271 RepID=UPI0011438AFA|nr:hypothetical protein [Rhodococcus sp. WS3]ROZ49381.1 hypothetical protein EEB13_05510 [Rhodococcus sp. WS3]
MTDFADKEDISNGWRALTSAEEIDVLGKISAVSQWIRDRKPSLLADDPQAKYVVVDVIRFALSNAKHAGHKSYSRTVGGVTRSGTLVDSGGSLVITDFHKELLGISKVATPRWNFGDGHG